MQIGDRFEIKRLESGLYKITPGKSDATSLVGGAASTAIALMRIVFETEAMEISTDKK